MYQKYQRRSVLKKAQQLFIYFYLKKIKIKKLSHYFSLIITRANISTHFAPPHIYLALQEFNPNDPLSKYLIIILINNIIYSFVYIYTHTQEKNKKNKTEHLSQRRRLKQMQDQSSDLSVCPSFNSYSSDRLADIAAEVSGEFSKLGLQSSSDAPPSETVWSDENDNDDFEFVSFSKAADEVFVNGPIGPVFPVFNRDLLSADFDDGRPELGRDEDEAPCPASSSSSSEADELDGIPAGTYCVWTPKGVPATPGRCKKSKSTGSQSKRWSFRELLRRSNSDGKDSFVFLTPSSSSRKTEEKVDHKITAAVTKGRSSVSSSKEGAKVAAVKGKKTTTAAVAAAHEVFYVRNRELNRNAEKRRSFLPYRQDLVGFFANVNTVGRTFPPF